MMKSIFVLLFLLCSVVASFAAKPSVLFSYCSFDNPSGKPYLEVYLNTAGKSVTAVKKQDGKYQRTIQVQLLVKKEKAVIYLDKYNLNSPLSSDSVLASDFVDVQRIVLENGTYTLEVKISDNNAATTEPFIVQHEILVNYHPDHLSISGIELLESYGPPGKEARFVKNGIEMIPYPDNYFPPGATSIRFYAEVYHSALAFGADSSYILRYRVEGNESGKTIANLGGIKKVKVAEVNVLLAEIPFDQLKSGNYTLVVEAVNRNNVVMASKNIFFQRSHQVLVAFAPENMSTINTEGTFVERITVADSLKEYIRCLFPTSTNNERSISADQVKAGDLKSMQRYFLYFWVTRDRFDPEGAWKEYKSRVDLVNANYQTWNRKGYETDRGRVYLEYGVPNEIETNYYEQSSYPHEFWHYYVLGEQRNKVFVFYCKNFSTNDFELIHSDANGEITQYRWQELLRNPQTGNDFGNTK